MRFLGSGLVVLLAAATALIAAMLVSGSGMQPVAWSRASEPPRPADALDAPMGAPLAPPPGVGGYTFMMTDDDAQPVRWDACRPIHVVVNRATMPPGADGLMGASLQRLTEVTGYHFVYDGTTDETPSSERPSVDEERYGDRWAPVLVAWTSPSQASGLAGEVAGYAGPMAMRYPKDNSLRYVSGQVVLDGPQIGRIMNSPGGVARAKAVIMHEMAHLIGLEHVDDEAELMYPSTTRGTVDFGAGDLRGLATLANGRCY